MGLKDKNSWAIKVITYKWQFVILAWQSKFCCQSVETGTENECKESEPNRTWLEDGRQWQPPKLLYDKENGTRFLLECISRNCKSGSCSTRRCCWTDVCRCTNCGNAITDGHEEDDCDSVESNSDKEWRELFVCRVKTIELFLLACECCFFLYPFSSYRIKVFYWPWPDNNLNPHKRIFGWFKDIKKVYLICISSYIYNTLICKLSSGELKFHSALLISFSSSWWVWRRSIKIKCTGT